MHRPARSLTAFVLTSLAVVTAQAEQLSVSSVLAHRWSFNGDYGDSVGGSAAEAIGAVDFSADEKSVVLPGGPRKSGSLDLGAGILPTDGRPFTIEIWAAQISPQAHSRIFSYHGDTTGPRFTMTWTIGTDVLRDVVHINKSVMSQAESTMAPYAFNVKYHISITVKPDHKGGCFMRWAKRNLATGAVEKSGSMEGAFYPPDEIESARFFIGQSDNNNDNDANASYDEVRVWNGVLSDDQLSANALAGPDALPDEVDAATSFSKAVWTGAANDGDVANAANWLCTDYAGNTLAGVLPNAQSAVYLSGELALQIPASKPLKCAELVCENVTLAADSDWRGLDAAEMNGVVSLAGNNLYVRGLPGSCTIDGTTGAAELVANGGFEDCTLANGWSYMNDPATVSDWSFERKAAKSGPGLTMANSPWITGAPSEGRVACFLQDDCRIYQTITVPKDGTYEISFYYAARPSYGDGRIHAEVDGVEAGAVDCGTVTSARLAQFQMDLTAGSHQFAIRHEQMGQKNSGWYCAWVDAVSIIIMPTSPAELHVDVEEGITRELTGALIKNFAKVVKDGAGTFVMSKDGQQYSGGTSVAAGTLGIGAPAALSSAEKPVEVAQGATAKIMQGGSGCAYDFALNGGRLAIVGGDFSGPAADAATSGTVTLGEGAQLLFDASAPGLAYLRLAAAEIETAGGGNVENAVVVTGVTSFEIAEEDNGDDGKAVKVVLSAVAATADWVGGATGDVDATASWVCRNAGGGLLENVLPDARTEVRFAGEFAAQFPSAAPRSFARVVFGEGARLAADCDWRGLGSFDFSGTLEIAGHKLYVADIAGSGTFTSEDGRELVANGGFEDCTLSGNWSYMSATVNAAGWIYQGPAANSCPGLTRENGIWKKVAAPEGAIACFLQNDCRIYQTLNVPEAGTYRMTFFYGARDNYAYGRIHAEIDGTAIGNVDVDEVLSERFAQFTVDLAAGSHTVTLRQEVFEGKDPGWFCAWVDAVSLRKATGVGELHVDVEEGREVVNGSVSLAGALKLVKDGAGTFRADMTAQKHFGGTDVKAGAFLMRPNGRPDIEHTLGLLGTDVYVDSGAVFDLNGSYAIVHQFVLNGGTMRNSLPQNNPAGSATLYFMSLEADSQMQLGQASAFIAPEWGPVRLDLQGHTLTIDGSVQFYAANVQATEGRIVLAGTTHLEFKQAASDLPSVVLDEGEGARVRVWPELANAPVSIGDYIARAAEPDANTSFTGGLKVHGIFKPFTDGFRGCELQDGATLDLSGWDETFSTKSGSLGEAEALTTVTFADGANVNVELGSRADLVDLAHSEAPYLVTWSAAPTDVTFNLSEKLVKRGFRVRPMDEGLLLYMLGGTTIYVR